MRMKRDGQSVGGAIHCALCPRQPTPFLALGQTQWRFPNLYGSIETCRGNRIPFRGPSYAKYSIVMAMVGGTGISCRGIPDLYSFIFACGGDVFSIRRPG